MAEKKSWNEMSREERTEQVLNRSQIPHLRTILGVMKQLEASGYKMNLAELQWDEEAGRPYHRLHLSLSYTPDNDTVRFPR